MNILATDFNTKSLLKYVAPTVLMMTFLSTYTIVDGLFISNLVGEDALAGLNIAWPVFNVILAIGLMFSTGGTAVMGKLMGEKKEGEARSFLSVLYLTAILLGGVITTLILKFPNEILVFLGVTEELYPYAMDYLVTLGMFATSFFLQVFVQSFFVLAGKPSLGFYTCLAGGMLNILLDYVFIAPNMLNLGIRGAAFATGIGNCVPALFGLVYFSVVRSGTLYFQRPIWRGKQLFQSMFNGSSELVSQLSIAITTLMFNVILLDLVDKAGVASITVILYIQMIQTAIYFGYSIGVAPVISYKYGAGDRAGLQKVMGISLRFVGVASLVVIGLSLLGAELAVSVFIPRSSATFLMAVEGLRIFTITYLFMGFNVFVSSLFTALSNGAVSGLLSFSRTLVFLVGALLILPHYWGIIGVWLAVPVAELLAILLSGIFYLWGKKNYGY